MGMRACECDQIERWRTKPAHPDGMTGRDERKVCEKRKGSEMGRTVHPCISQQVAFQGIFLVDACGHGAFRTCRHMQKKSSGQAGIGRSIYNIFPSRHESLIMLRRNARSSVLAERYLG
jgi:hypothetical protein